MNNKITTGCQAYTTHRVGLSFFNSEYCIPYAQIKFFAENPLAKNNFCGCGKHISVPKNRIYGNGLYI